MKTGIEAVATWLRKQAIAREIAQALRNPNGYSKEKARQLALLDRVANFDKKITEDEIRIRLRAGDWK